MKKLLIKTLLLLLVFATSIFALELQNSRIKLGTDIVGNLKIWSTGGDPNYPQDDNKNILNNKNFGSTFILVSVDGYLARFGSSKGKTVKFSFKVNNQIVSSWKFQGVLFTQYLSIHNGSYSGNNNLVKVKLIVENKAPADKKIGLRVVVDPNLGSDDGNSLFVTESGDLKSGKAFYAGKGFPGFLFGCDRPYLSYANFALNLYGKNLVMPDKLYVGSKRYSEMDNTLDISRDSSFSGSFKGKSSVAMVWNPKSFYSGQKDGIAYSVGLLNSKRLVSSSIDMIFVCPKRVYGDEFWVSTVIENSDKFWKLKDIKLGLKLDSSKFEIVSSKTTFSFSELASKKKLFGWWRIKPKGSGVGKIGVVVNSVFRGVASMKILEENVSIDKY